MDAPTMMPPRRVAPGTDLLGSYIPLPGFGMVPVNAFVIHATQPVLVDTGLLPLREEFLQHLASVVALEELRWIWLTHTDPDHTGSLAALLERAPHARLVTTYLGMAKLSLHGLPVEKAAYLLNPGQSLDVGDRLLVAMAPPTYDAPETCGLFDTCTRVFFSADSFGALLQEPAESAAALSPRALKDGLELWATIDAPWLALVEGEKFSHALDSVRRMAPTTILSSHLPPASGMHDRLLGLINNAREAPAFIGPDQAALERMMAQMAVATSPAEPQLVDLRK